MSTLEKILTATLSTLIQAKTLQPLQALTLARKFGALVQSIATLFLQLPRQAQTQAAHILLSMAHSKLMILTAIVTASPLWRAMTTKSLSLTDWTKAQKLLLALAITTQILPTRRCKSMVLPSKTLRQVRLSLVQILATMRRLRRTATLSTLQAPAQSATA